MSRTPSRPDARHCRHRQAVTGRFAVRTIWQTGQRCSYLNVPVRLFGAGTLRVTGIRARAATPAALTNACHSAPCTSALWPCLMCTAACASSCASTSLWRARNERNRTPTSMVRVSRRYRATVVVSRRFSRSVTRSGREGTAHRRARRVASSCSCSARSRFTEGIVCNGGGCVNLARCDPSSGQPAPSSEPSPAHRAIVRRRGK